MSVFICIRMQIELGSTLSTNSMQRKAAISQMGYAADWFQIGSIDHIT